MPTAESPAGDPDVAGLTTEESEEDSAQRRAVGQSVTLGSRVLRVVIEGLAVEDARAAVVTVTGVDERSFDRSVATDEQWLTYVKWVQRSLNRVVGSALEIDGQPGPQIQDAVRTFQRREGLPTSGRVDPKTEAALIGYDVAQNYAPQWPDDVRGSWPCQGLSSEFGLDPFFAAAAERREDVRVDTLEVAVDHPVHLIATTRVPLTDGIESDDGTTVYEVRVTLDPAAVFHGRVTREDGVAASEAQVGIVQLEDDFPIDKDGVGVKCGADGAFDIRVAIAGPYALASYEEGRRPTTMRVEAVLGSRHDLGDIVIEPGHAITGFARRGDEPLAGAAIDAIPPTWRTASPPGVGEEAVSWSVYEGRSFRGDGWSMHLLWLAPGFDTEGANPRENGRFELGRQRVGCDASGAFAFRGLGEGEYILRIREVPGAPESLPGLWDDAGGKERYRINGDKPALLVRAPEHGVEFAMRWTTLRFELSGDLAREDDGRLLLKKRSAYATPVDENGVDLRLVADPNAKGLNFVPEIITTQFALSKDETSYAFQAPPEQELTGEVVFPGRPPSPFAFRTAKSGGEVVVPVELEPIQETATLVIALENPRDEISDTFRVRSWRDGMYEFPPDIRKVAVVDGQLKIEDLFPGTHRVELCAGKNGYEQGLFHRTTFEIELDPGQVVTRPVTMPKGAGLRVTVRGEDGKLLSGEYEFFDDKGNRKWLNLFVDVGGGRYGGSSWKIYPYANHESFSELSPGGYELLLRSSGYEEKRVMVDLRQGEYEDVEVTLSESR